MTIFLFDLIDRFDKQKLRHAYGVLRVNSFAIDTIRGGKGRALFPMTALISHSCQPNVLHEPISYGSNEFQANKQGMYILLQPKLVSQLFNSLIYIDFSMRICF